MLNLEGFKNLQVMATTLSLAGLNRSFHLTNAN
nr:MAG TPA: hypothetical protein [Caudoviricetes sp.]